MRPLLDLDFVYMSNVANEITTVVLSTRVAPELARVIEQRAVDADRSTAGEVRHLLKRALEADQEASAV